MPQVSVVVLTYNPDNQKLRQTLRAAAAQKDISLEILISDDGSARKDFSFLPEFMQELGIADYRLLEHEENRGTVQSCLSAVRAARGEYVFLTSPGDYLFDGHVLRDLYRFATENQSPLCFGNAVFYTSEDGVPRLTRTYGSPESPELYRVGSKHVKAAFFSGCWVIGASYFRKRDLLEDCLTQMGQASKYMEDTPSTAFALAMGHMLTYCDRNTVWYEDGTGVSTGAGDKWKKLLHQDALESFRALKKKHPRDPYVDIAFRNLSQKNRVIRLAGRLLRHPVLTAQITACKKAPKKPVACREADLERLKTLLQTR